MNYIFVNLKRFDIPNEFGGVNSLCPIKDYGSAIVSKTQELVKNYKDSDVEFVIYFQEAHLLSAVSARTPDSKIKIGCQSVFYDDTAKGGNFGAFTTNRTANAAKALGCGGTIIGHCEERRDIAAILSEAGVNDTDAANRILNKKVKCAANAGLKVLYCIGEKAEEQDNWQEVLRKQLEIGLDGINKSDVVIAYEPVWAIGPGKTPPDKEYVTKIVDFVKEVTGGIPVVYGGGLKEDNAKMLSSIPELDGGLIALTRFKGDIGFYPDEFGVIVEKFMEERQ